MTKQQQQAPDTGFTVGEALPAETQTELERGRAALQQIVDLTPEQVAGYIQQRDDELLMQQMLGQVSDAWFYQFKVAGKMVEGVSVIGAEQFARLRAEQGFPIRFPVHNIVARDTTRHGVEGVEVLVVARDYRTGGEGTGMAFYPWYAARREGAPVFDDKADRKALAVAKRNAILDLVPEHMVRELLHAFRSGTTKANMERQAEAARAENAWSRNPVPVTARGDEDADPYGAPMASFDQRAKLHTLAANELLSEKDRRVLSEACETARLTAEVAGELIAKASAKVARRSADSPANA